MGRGKTMIMVGPSVVSGEFRMWCTKCNNDILRRTKAVRARTITDLANTHELKCSAWFKRDDPSAEATDLGRFVVQELDNETGEQIPSSREVFRPLDVNSVEYRDWGKEPRE